MSREKHKYYWPHFLLKNRPNLSHKGKLAKNGGWNIRFKPDQSKTATNWITDNLACNGSAFDCLNSLRCALKPGYGGDANVGEEPTPTPHIEIPASRK